MYSSHNKDNAVLCAKLLLETLLTTRISQRPMRWVQQKNRRELFKRLKRTWIGCGDRDD